VYNHRRIAKKVSGAVRERYLWQGLTRLLAVYDSNDSLLMRFEYADARMPVAMTAGSVKYYLAYDQAGTLKAVADSSGNAVKRIEYDTFGNIINDTAPAFAVPFGFAGGLYDKDTKLVRFGYRDYDPETGRWTAKDPILFAGGDTDLYGYCVNDPLSFTDPRGTVTVYAGYGASFFMGDGGFTDYPAGINTTVSSGFIFYTEQRGNCKEPLYMTYGAESDPDSALGGGADTGWAVGFMTGTLNDFKGKATNLTVSVIWIGITFTVNDAGAWGFSASWGGKGTGFGYYMNETNTVTSGPIGPCPQENCP
jgi:RHS repeat-associated protein